MLFTTGLLRHEGRIELHPKVPFRLQEEEAAAAPAQRRAPGRGIDTLMLLDRAVDVVTPCCTQLTYEGLIDEVYGIVNGAVQLDPGECCRHLAHFCVRP